MAEITVGVLSLASLLSLFQTCNRAYEVFIRSAKYIGKDAYILGVRLETERAKLRLWGRWLGISANQKCRLLRAESLETQNLVITLLEATKSILDNIDVIAVRYGVRIFEEGQNEAVIMDAGIQGLNLDEIQNCPAVEVAKIRRERTESSIVNSTSRLGKLRWALSDNDKMSKFVEDLERLNENLWVSLPMNSWLKLVKGLPSYVLPEIDDQEVLSDLEHREKDSETGKLLAACSVLRRSALFAKANESKNSFAQDLLEDSRNVEWFMDLKSQNKQQPSPQRHLAHILDSEKVPCIVEWRYVEQEEMRIRIKSLAYLLSSAKSSEFGLLKCVGFYRDDESYINRGIERYGLLFRLPVTTPPLSANSCPRTLAEYIATPKTPPTLTDRFRIATALCHTVLQIHAAGWLHKAIQSDNILFASVVDSSSPDGTILDLANPFLLGFDSSRPDSFQTQSLDLPTGRTSNDYRHPLLWKPGTIRFKKGFDIYSLGVVLLEVGCWKLVSSSSSPRDPNQPWVWRDSLLSRAKSLGFACGSIYQRVVETCLTGHFDGRRLDLAGEEASTGRERSSIPEETTGDIDETPESSVVHDFLFDVVYELGKCCA